MIRKRGREVAIIKDAISSFTHVRGVAKIEGHQKACIRSIRRAAIDMETLPVSRLPLRPGDLTCAVKYDESALAKKTNAVAHSTGWPARPMGAAASVTTGEQGADL